MPYKPMYGCKGYEISDLGLVRNARTKRPLRQFRSDKSGKRSTTKRHIWVCRPWGVMNPKPIHIAVLESHVGPRPHGTVASFIDGNTNNLAIDNLRWTTRSESSRLKKLTDADVRFVRVGHQMGVKPKDFATLYGVTRETIYKIINGKARTNV